MSLPRHAAQPTHYGWQPATGAWPHAAQSGSLAWHPTAQCWVQQVDASAGLTHAPMDCSMGHNMPQIAQDASGFSPEFHAVAAFMEQLGIDLAEENEFGWIAELGLQTPLPPRWSSCVDAATG